MNGYSYEELIDDLTIGHEIEFFYNNEKYSISNNDRGWYLTKFNSDEYQTFNNADDLLKNAKIDSKPLIEIWELIKVETIY